MRWKVSSLSVAIALTSVSASAAERAAEPEVRPTLLWGAMQLVPSPEVVVGQGAARLGLRWQVTPLLYSWGVNRKLSPWRGLIVEPNVRHSGSIEVFLSPEYVGKGDTFGDRWLFRPGVRAYFPLKERGDYLSMSIGSSFFRFQRQSGAAFEGGIYTLFGVLGLQVTYSPSPHTPLELITTLRFRYF